MPETVQANVEDPPLEMATGLAVKDEMVGVEKTGGCDWGGRISKYDQVI